MQIKAQGLLNAAKFIETQYGRDALGAVVRACSEPVRDRYISAIAINWHPIEEFLEFVQTADKILGDGKGKLIEEIGAAGARANLKGMAVRIAFYMAQPDFFFRRVAGLWHQFNDEGEMITHAIAERSGAVEVAGISQPNAIFCGVLTGWIREVSTALGIEDPSPRHTQCRARGDARCYWEIRWTALQPDQQGEREARESIDRLQTKPPSVVPTAPSVAPTAPSSGAVRAYPPSSQSNPSSGPSSRPSSRPSSVGRIAPVGPVRTSSQSSSRSASAPPPSKGSRKS